MKEIVIDGKVVDHFVVSRYYIEGDKLVITHIRANDENGFYIRFVKLDKVLPYLSYYPVSFKQMEGDK
jgi:hypothetical protein